MYVGLALVCVLLAVPIPTYAQTSPEGGVVLADADVPASSILHTGTVVPAGNVSHTSRTIPAEQVIPRASDDLQWEGEVAIYKGDHLFEYINGGAPQYLEYGFIEVASQELIWNGHTYIFDVYRMSTSLNAFGIFSVRRPAVAPLIGRFLYSSLTTYQGLIAHGPYLIEIAAYESTEETPAEMAELADLAAARLDPSLAIYLLTTKPPFTCLPLAGRHPGTEKLARGPVGLRAALGSAVGGVFFGATEAVQVALAKAEILRREQAEQTKPASPAGRTSKESGPAPTWVVCGYHPRADAEGILRPETILALLVRPKDPVPLMRSVGAAIATGSRVDAMEADRGWIWTEAAPGQSHGAALQRGADLIFISSKLPEEDFRAWVADLVSP